MDPKAARVTGGISSSTPVPSTTNRQAPNPSSCDTPAWCSMIGPNDNPPDAAIRTPTVGCYDKGSEGRPWTTKRTRPSYCELR
jgi:hypothetical protein